MRLISRVEDWPSIERLGVDRFNKEICSLANLIIAPLSRLTPYFAGTDQNLPGNKERQ